jgi:hypothetical protein
MNVNSGGPHILLFERDQQLTTLLSSELGQAGYEVHMARTAVEVFDVIARFPVRLVMVDLAQAQAGRREFWVALDAQRRGRGVQVFTFRCANLGGYGPDDPDERVETVLTDLEVDGPGGIGRLVEAVRARVPGSTVTTSAPARPAPSMPESYQSARVAEAPLPPAPRQASPIYQPMQQPSPVYQPPRQASPVYQSMQQASPVYQSASMPAVPPVQQAAPAQQAVPQYQQPAQPQAQPLQGILRPQPQEAPVPPPPARAAEPPRSGHSTFTDKIRAVFYPSSQSFSPVAEPTSSSYPSSGQPQPAAQYQTPDVQPRPRASQRFAEAEYPAAQNNREEMVYPSSSNPSPASTQSYSHYLGSSTPSNMRAPQEESGLDQLTRMLRESQPNPQNITINGNIQHSAPQTGLTMEAQEAQDFRAHAMPQNTPQEVQDFRSQIASQNGQEAQDFRAHAMPQNAMVSGNMQNPAARPGLTIDPREIQDFRSQILQAARMDEAHERSNAVQPRIAESPNVGTQLRASPIQDIPFEQEVAHRKGTATNGFAQGAESFSRPAMTILQPTQSMPQMQQQAQVVPQTPQAQTFAHMSQQAQAMPQMQQQTYPSFTDAQTSSSSGTQPRPVASTEMPVASASTSQLNTLSPVEEVSPQGTLSNRHTSGPLNLDDDFILSEQVRADLQQTINRRPEVRTSDDMLLDIVKSLPPMSPAPQPPQPQAQVLNGRATRSLGSVLLEGHLVPQERLQVAQHVQRMMRGVDLNYQLGEILLMFKLLTPDQLLAASLVSYGMISTVQISALGRIRQELHAMGLEYDLESLLVLFRILSPEQLREVRASWSS